jgi:flagellar protein FlbD
MIILTRLNGEQFAVNCDLVERIDAHPNTVLTLVDTTKYIVAETLTEVVERVRDFRAGVLARSAEMTQRLPVDGAALASVAALRLVNDHQDEN